MHAHFNKGFPLDLSSLHRKVARLFLFRPRRRRGLLWRLRLKRGAFSERQTNKSREAHRSVLEQRDASRKKKMHNREGSSGTTLLALNRKVMDSDGFPILSLSSFRIPAKHRRVTTKTNRTETRERRRAREREHSKPHATLWKSSQGCS